MLALWMFGSPLAVAWGAKRFLRFYLICGVGAGLLIVRCPSLPLLFGLGTRRRASSLPTLGASGAIFGVLLAYSLTWPDRTIMLLFPPIPFRAIWFIPFLFVMEFFVRRRATSATSDTWAACSSAGSSSAARAASRSCPRLRPAACYRWRRYACGGSSTRCSASSSAPGATDSRLH